MKATRMTACAALMVGALYSSPSTAEDTTAITYSFVEGAYVHDNFNANGLQITDRDGIGNVADDNFGTLFDDAGHGWGIRGSVALPFKTKAFGLHLAGDYVRTTHDVGIDIVNVAGVRASGLVDTTQSEWRAAIGAHGFVSDRFSLFAEFGIVQNKVNFSTASLQLETGAAANADLAMVDGQKTSFDAKAGIRALATRNLELTGFVRYHGNGDMVTSSDGQQVSFSGKVKAGAGLFYHVNRRLGVGVDYEFGKPGRARLAARISF